MCYGLDDLESGYGRKRGIFVLISHIGCETDNSRGKYRRVHVHLVCDTDIILGCRVNKNTRGWGRYSVSYIIIGCMETVEFKYSLRFEIWIEIRGWGRMGLVVLKVSGQDL